MKRFTTIIALTLLSQTLLLAAVKPVGFSFVQNYPKDVYGAGTQVWSIIQDEEEIMYFGNNNGLLIFDGSAWRTYPIPNRSIIRSVYASKNDGRIYVGGSNDFGYFQSDRQGRLLYTSLLNLIPDGYRDFGEVWTIFPHSGGYIFHAFNAVFFFRNDSILIFSYDRNFHYSFDVEGELYIREIGKGLFKLDKKTFIPIKNTEIFGDLTVMGILKYDENSVLVATREKGLFLVDDKEVRIFSGKLTGYFEENQIFSSVKIDNDFFAFGTIQDGLIILDRKGTLVQHINRERGLQNNTVLSLFTDKRRNLWLGLDNGIDYVQINSPLSYYVHQNVVGAVYVIAKQDNDIYLASNQGLFSTRWPPVQATQDYRESFRFINRSQGQVWMLYNKHGRLLAGHDKGTYEVRGQTLVQVSDYPGGWSFLEVPGDPQYLIEGTYSGIILYRIKPQGGGWELIGKIDGFNQSCKQIQFDKEGFLWVGHGYKGIYRLKLNSTYDSVISIQHYTKESGLPSTYNLNVLKFYGRILIGTPEGIYSFDSKENTFNSEPELSKLFNNRNVSNLLEDNNGDCWYFTENEMGILKPNFDGNYSRIYMPFLPIRNKLISSYENVYTVDKSNILIATEAGVIHFDPTYSKSYDEVFKVKIRKVEILPDSLLFDGYPKGWNEAGLPVLKYRYNGLRFTYAAQFYEMPAEVEYSIRLEGFDRDWSDWSRITEKEYTNLSEGNYAFQVKARNIYGTQSSSMRYEFIVQPPLYRSTLAYIFYLIVILSGIIFSIILVFRKIEKEKKMMHEKQKATLLEKEKAHTEQVIRAEQEIIRLRNEKLEAENQKNLTELEGKSKELASIAMQISYKNELLNQIKQKLIHVSGNMIHHESKLQVNKLIKTLEKDLLNREDWERFEMYFDQVHEDFIKKLRKFHTGLTPKDLRLCSYLKMNLSSKEIAPILNISVRGVEISRYRLRKKMDLPHDENLTEYLMNI